MIGQLTEDLVRLRQFPPVVHPRHAREVLHAGESALLADWVGGYAITASDHRRFIEDTLASLAWKAHGQAVLVHGLYGTGKSHSLVLLHLLQAMESAWAPFVDRYPEYRRFREAIHGHRRLVIHFSLDEYGAQIPLETALAREITQACGDAGLTTPLAWDASLSRLEIWTGVLSACQSVGYDGIVLLIDELSLFLAGKSPAKREADAAFLQFLADFSLHAPLWFIGAMQKRLADVGALRTHSWRQVEDRFRRYALTPQEISSVIREKLFQRNDQAAIRSLIAEHILPRTIDTRLDLSSTDLFQQWPFHPKTVSLLLEVANNYLSPHRSLVEILQAPEVKCWLQRPSDRLITLLDIFSLIEGDLQRHDDLSRFWNAVSFVQHSIDETDNNAQLLQQAVRLLALLHLANQPATVHQLCMLLFDGQTAPTIEQLSGALHRLHGRSAYLSVTRAAEPGSELFTLAIEDDAGATALTRMQEIQQTLLPDDARVIECVFSAGTNDDWPFSAILNEYTLPVPWNESERSVLVSYATTLQQETIARLFEGLLAGRADGHVLFLPPGIKADVTTWTAITEKLEGPHRATFLCWLPRALTHHEQQLWQEYTAWQMAAQIYDAAATPHERRIRRRCETRAEELRMAVDDSLRAIYQEGQGHSACGASGTIPREASLAATLAALLQPGFEQLYPIFTMVTPHGLPGQALAKQLITYVIGLGECTLSTASPLLDAAERYLEPLGCVTIDGSIVHVTPPRQEITEYLLEHLTSEPLRFHDAMALLQRPPVGLSSLQSRFVLLAAVRSRLLDGLDAFLQPLPGDTAQLDEPVFLAAASPIEPHHTPIITELAEHWHICSDSWTLKSNQVYRQLEEWAHECRLQIPAIRSVMQEWSGTLSVMPWSWRHTEQALAALEALGDRPTAASLVALIETDSEIINRLDQARGAVSWWQEQHLRLGVLLNATLPNELHQDTGRLHEELQQGEASLIQLDSIAETITTLTARFESVYREWHESIYGTTVVTALRQVFDSADFRAVKRLSQLPMPMPIAACDSLHALTQARSSYCPGIYTHLSTAGCCAHCHLPWGSASPMPDALLILQSAQSALQSYADLLLSDPWAISARERLHRAPEKILCKGTELFAWTLSDGAERLLQLLDEELLSWLSRDHTVAGSRSVRVFQQQLSGKDLTVADVQGITQRWLDPDGTLSENALLSFE